METAEIRDKVLRSGECALPVADRSVRKRLGALYRGKQEGETAVISVPVLYGRTGCGGRAASAAAGKLLAAGYLPESFAPVILLPPGSMESELRAIADEIRETCLREEMTVSGIHAEVTGDVLQPVVVGTASGRRMEPAAGALQQEPVQIVMTGYAAAEACRLIAAGKREELERVFPASFADRCLKAGASSCSLRRTAEILRGEGSCRMVYLSGGGLYAGLWELMELAGCGLRVETEAVPLLQESIEVAEYYDFDPFAAMSGGCFLAAVPDGDRVKERISAAGVKASVIGTLTRGQTGRAGILVHGEETRFLDLPPADAVIKVFEKL